MDKITTVLPLDDFRLDIITSSGVSGIFDVKPYLQGPAFHELNDPDYFKRVKPAHHGIRWPNGQDFSSDTIIWDITEHESQRAAESGSAYGLINRHSDKPSS